MRSLERLIKKLEKAHSSLLDKQNEKEYIVTCDKGLTCDIIDESFYKALLSMAQLCDLGFKCIFRVDDVEIISVDGSNLIFEDFRYENLYLVDFNACEAQLSTCLFTKSSIF
jgi:hypothetical protein